MALPGAGHQLVGDDTKGRKDTWEGNNDMKSQSHTHRHTYCIYTCTNIYMVKHLKRDIRALYPPHTIDALQKVCFKIAGVTKLHINLFLVDFIAYFIG